jgi:acyl-CoA thioesterase I
VFVLELGANDGLRGLPLDQTEKNLQAIINKVKSKYPKTKIVIAGMMVPPNMGPAYTERFKKIFPDLAKKNNATLIPFLLADVAGNEKLNQADGIHPTAEGHKIVASTVTKFIEPLL